MTSKNPRRVAGQIRVQLRIQRNRVVAGLVVGMLCTTLIAVEHHSLSTKTIVGFGLFGLYGFFMAFMDAGIWRQRRKQLAELERDAA